MDDIDSESRDQWPVIVSYTPRHPRVPVVLPASRWGCIASLRPVSRPRFSEPNGLVSRGRCRPLPIASHFDPPIATPESTSIGAFAPRRRRQTRATNRALVNTPRRPNSPLITARLNKGDNTPHVCVGCAVVAGQHRATEHVRGRAIDRSATPGVFSCVGGGARYRHSTGSHGSDVRDRVYVPAASCIHSPATQVCESGERNRRNGVGARRVGRRGEGDATILEHRDRHGRRVRRDRRHLRGAQHGRAGNHHRGRHWWPSRLAKPATAEAKMEAPRRGARLT